MHAKASLKSILPAAFLVAQNVLGVGLLALPIKVGVTGFFPSILEILIISSLMVVSAYVIANRLPLDQPVFDLPSFFAKQLGPVGKWTAIIFNLLLLYGILTAYLSGISTIIISLLPFSLPFWLITVLYFCIAVSIVVFGQEILKKGTTILIFLIWGCFIVLTVTGTKQFDPSLLTYTRWDLLPLGLPVLISAFHFHNVIPTVISLQNRDLHAAKKAILIGVGMGVLINLIWVLIVLGTLPEKTIFEAMLKGTPATVPMSNLLNSGTFTIAGLLFAVFAITGSFAANGSGLYSFVKDLFYNFCHKKSLLLSALFAFVPPLLITLIYPNIFLDAIDIVGGIAEAMLFVALPGAILIRRPQIRSKLTKTFGYILFFIGVIVMLYVVGEKLQLIQIG